MFRPRIADTTFNTARPWYYSVLKIRVLADLGENTITQMSSHCSTNHKSAPENPRDLELVGRIKGLPLSLVWISKSCHSVPFKLSQRSPSNVFIHTGQVGSSNHTNFLSENEHAATCFHFQNNDMSTPRGYVNVRVDLGSVDGCVHEGHTYNI